MNSATKNRIISFLVEVMERVRGKACELPLEPEVLREVNPFGARLVPMEIWRASKFERSFVTTLGQSVYERIAKYVAQGTGALAETQCSTELTICTFRLETVESILAAQRENRKSPNWEDEVRSVRSLKNESQRSITVRSDLYVRRADGTKEYYTMKTVKPNLDQTERAKRDMLFLVAAGETDEVFFSLPYNPAGEGHSYREAGHGVPYKLFQMDCDPCVLIGSKFWNRVGMSDKVYNELLEIFDHVGSQFLPQIRRQCLGW